MTERRGDWMQTFTGRQYWPIDPRPADVSLEDIAHHLAMICRYGGACSRHYSVAEHSVYVSYLVPPGLAAHALLHDASEAYCNDIVRPVKRHLAGYEEIEGLNVAVIGEAFGLSGLTPDECRAIKDADNAILLAEQAQLMAAPPAKWAPLDIPETLVDEANRLLRGGLWGNGNPARPPDAKWPFLRRAAKLGLS